MTKNIKHVVFPIFIFLLAFSLGIFKQVQRSEAKSGGAPFVVAPLPKESPTQIDPNLGYYYLRVTPGQEQKIEMTIHNNLDKKQTVLVYPTTAATSDTGAILYNDLSKERDPSLKYDFTKFAFKQQSVVLKAKETRLVTITFTMPDYNYNGMIMGGVFVTTPLGDNSTATKTKQGKTGLVIKNRFGYAMAVGLQENDNTVIPQLKLNRVAPGIGGGNKPVVNANLQNYKRWYIKDMTLKSKLYRYGAKKPFATQNQEGMEVAANTNFTYAVDWHNKEVKAGKYTLVMDAKTAGQSWHFKRNFIVSPDEANKLNALQPKKPNYLLWIIIIVLAIILIILLSGVLIYRLGRRQGKNENGNRE